MKITLLCVIQTCFESSMYIFVFQWTHWLERPLDLAVSHLPHGLIFSCFMLCLMIGSQLYLRFKSVSLNYIFLTSAVALYMPTLFQDNLAYISLSFFVFEGCCGIYFPSISSLRGTLIPEHIRASLMSLFRVGLNIIVIVVLESVSVIPTDNEYYINSI